MSTTRSKHAFGSKANVTNALEQGLIDAYDILFLDGENENPSLGWIDKEGNPVYVEADTSELKNQVEELESQVATQVANLESQMTVLEDALADHAVNEYEISGTPDGAMVDYRDKEIRVLCPVNTEWAKQNVGANGDANQNYMCFKAYAPEGAVSFKEDLAETIADQTMYYFENNDFAGVDANGNKYSIVWLALAKFDEVTGAWTYYGANSNADHYVGFYYSVEWYDANGKMIGSDCIRINLANEDCYSLIEPYYVAEASKEVDNKIGDAVMSANSYTDEQIANAFTIIEF